MPRPGMPSLDFLNWCGRQNRYPVEWAEVLEALECAAGDLAGPGRDGHG